MLASRERKLISGVKRDYQMQTESRPPPDKDIDVGFSGEQKGSQSLLQPGWQLSRKKQVNCHAGNYFLSAPGSQLDNDRRNAELMAHKTQGEVTAESIISIPSFRFGEFCERRSDKYINKKQGGCGGSSEAAIRCLSVCVCVHIKSMKHASWSVII